jgi:hypothetical protein
LRLLLLSCAAVKEKEEEGEGLGRNSYFSLIGTMPKRCIIPEKRHSLIGKDTVGEVEKE